MIDRSQLGMSATKAAIRYQAAVAARGLHANEKGGEGVHDLADRPVVQLQSSPHAAGKILLPESDHVEGGRSTKPIDRLLGVTHGPKILTVSGQGSEQADATSIHILILIDQHVIVLILEMHAHCGVTFQ